MPAILQLALDLWICTGLWCGPAGRARRSGLGGGRHPPDQECRSGCGAGVKKALPGKTIVADMKIMDAGRIEVESAAKAGAQIIDVLGTATDATIEECIQAGKNYGAKIAVDLIAVADPVARARQVEAWGRLPHGARGH